MKGGSHLLIGLAATYALHRLALPLAVSPLDWLTIAAGAAVGALLPDIDSDESAIRQSTGTARSSGFGGRLISFGVRALSGGHRNFTHTLAACAVTGLAACALNWFTFGALAPGIAFAAAYLSHLLADSLTVQGVPLLWPLWSGNIAFLPRPLRVRTGSFAEYAIVVALGVITYNLWSNA